MLVRSNQPSLGTSYSEWDVDRSFRAGGKFTWTRICRSQMQSEKVVVSQSRCRQIAKKSAIGPTERFRKFGEAALHIRDVGPGALPQNLGQNSGLSRIPAEENLAAVEIVVRQA